MKENYVDFKKLDINPRIIYAAKQCGLLSSEGILYGSSRHCHPSRQLPPTDHGVLVAAVASQHCPARLSCYDLLHLQCKTSTGAAKTGCCNNNGKLFSNTQNTNHGPAAKRCNTESFENDLSISALNGGERHAHSVNTNKSSLTIHKTNISSKCGSTSTRQHSSLNIEVSSVEDKPQFLIESQKSAVAELLLKTNPVLEHTKCISLKVKEQCSAPSSTRSPASSSPPPTSPCPTETSPCPTETSPCRIETSPCPTPTSAYPPPTSPCPPHSSPCSAVSLSNPAPLQGPASSSQGPTPSPQLPTSQCNAPLLQHSPIQCPAPSPPCTTLSQQFSASTSHCPTTTQCPSPPSKGPTPTQCPSPPSNGPTPTQCPAPPSHCPTPTQCPSPPSQCATPSPLCPGPVFRCPVLASELPTLFAPGSLVEVCGESGCGKTQLALSLALNAVLPKQAGGLASKVAYLCTEGQFPSSRLQQMVAAVNRSGPVVVQHAAVADSVMVQHIPDLLSLSNSIRYQLPALLRRARPQVALVLLDSVAAPFRAEAGDWRWTERQARLHHLGHALRQLATEHHCSVVVINQVTARYDLPDLYGQGDLDEVTPALGLAWSNLLTSRLMLHRTASTTCRQLGEEEACGGTLSPAPTVPRTMQLLFCPWLPRRRLPFTVAADGVRGVTAPTGP